MAHSDGSVSGLPRADILRVASCSECHLPLGSYVDALAADLADTQSAVHNAVRSYSYNNLPPDGPQTDLFKLKLVEATDNIKFIDESIETVHIMWKKLKAVRAALQTTVKGYTLALNPARRIPHDILLEIFAWCMEEQKSRFDPRRCFRDPAALRWIQKTPWILSHVASSWRKAAYSFPLLWSDIFFYYKGPYATGNTKLLARQLTYARSHPLSVTMIATPTLEVAHWQEGNCGFHTSPHLTSLIMSAPRWNSLRLCIPKLGYDFLRKMEYMLDTLQSISISVFEQSFGRAPYQIVPTTNSFIPPTPFTTAFNLCSLHCHPSFILAFDQVSLNRITNYSVPFISSCTTEVGETLTPQNLIQSLKKLENLESCTVFCQNQSPSQVDPFKAPKTLVSLTITEDPTRPTLVSVLKLLTVTSLKTFAVYSSKAIEYILESQLLVRSSPELDSLTLGLTVGDPNTDLKVDQASLIHLVKISPTLRFLALAYSPTLDSLNEILEKGEARSLSRLTLLSGGMAHEKMVEIRVEMKKSYPKLEIHFKPRSFFILPIPF